MSLSARLQPHHRVFAVFAIYAFGLGQIFPRLPDIKFAMGIEEGALGLALMGISVGTITALTLSTALVTKIGHRIAMLALVPAMSLFFAIASFANDPLAFFFLLILAGLCIGAVEIIINVEADRVEAGMDRRIMSRAHAFWSLGFFGAAAYSAIMVKFGITPQTQLMASIPICILLTWLCLQAFQPATIRATDSHDKPPIVAKPTFAIMVLVGVTLSSMLLEGASIDWTAIYMDSVFVAIPEMGAIGVATAALSQGMVRYFGDRFVDRFAPTRVARGMQTVMALGVITVFFAPDPLVALVGFALSRGRQRDDVPACHVCSGATDRPARSHQRRGFGAIQLCDVSAGAAPSWVHCRTLRSALDLWDRAATDRAQLRSVRGAWVKANQRYEKSRIGSVSQMKTDVVRQSLTGPKVPRSHKSMERRFETTL